MSGSPLVTAIGKRLSAADYAIIPTPFKVASVSFDFTVAMRGRGGRSLDLIIIVDTTTGDFGDKDAVLVRRRIEALSRALDVTKSRLVLTVILAGATMTTEIEALSEICRVLTVEAISVEIDGTPKDEQAARLLDDRVRLLLPLEIPLRDPDRQGDESPMERLLKSLPLYADPKLVTGVIEASALGEEAVTAAAAAVIDAALVTEVPE